MNTETEAILDRLASTDPQAAEALRRQFELLSSRREFGLNFRRHLPERVSLPGRPISAGDKVVFLPARGATKAESDATWIVEAVTTKQVATVRNTITGETVERDVDDLVFAAEFRDPIHPGLNPLHRISNGPDDAPVHAVIKGENFHVLEALRYTHTGKVDLIYIDPPYNTGNRDWIYNDRHIDPTDGDRHSKWLAFMERRLILARDLLADTGTIFVAIGDDEHHRLRMLMDQVFGTGNFISNIVWQGGRKNDSRFVSNGGDYMLVYGKDRASWVVEGVKVTDAPDVHDLSATEIPTRGARWREPKAGLHTAIAKAAEIWESSGSHSEAQTAWRKWMREFKASGVPTDAVSRFTTLDAMGKPIRTDQDLSWPGGGGPRYEVLHPTTNQPVVVPTSGWRFPDPETMTEAIQDGRVYFGKDHTTQPGRVSRLEDLEVQVAMSVFEAGRTDGANHLFFARTGTGVFNEKRFPNPKNHDVLMRWIRIAAPRDAVVLDFFAGSGSTAEAVIRLNAEGGGTRQCILVTNNELAAADAKKLTKAGHRIGDPEWEARGVFEYVTRPRIETVVTGVRPDGSTYSEGLPANVEFFELTYENPEVIEMDMAFARVAPLLWLQAGGVGRRIDTDPGTGFDIADTYAVLFHPDAAHLMLEKLRNTPEGTIGTVFIVTEEETQFRSISQHLPAGMVSSRLYSSYLNTFTINTGLAD